MFVIASMASFEESSFDLFCAPSIPMLILYWIMVEPTSIGKKSMQNNVSCQL